MIRGWRVIQGLPSSHILLEAPLLERGCRFINAVLTVAHLRVEEIVLWKRSQ